MPRPADSMTIRPALLVMALAAAGCQTPAVAPEAGGLQVSREYDRDTGRLEQLALERKDGSTELRAFMQGTRFERIEIDTNGDGRPDRWEFYDVRNVILRAEQSTRFDGTVSRWEHYEGGVIVRVEEDVSGDGRVDKWERYVGGALVELDLDLAGRGRPDRRLRFGADGSSEVIELP